MIIELRESYTHYNLMTNEEEFTMTKTTTTTNTTNTTTNNGWEKIAKRNLKYAYNWTVGGMENSLEDGQITQERFDKWIAEQALEGVYSEGITTHYDEGISGGEAPKEMRFAGKEFCYKYLISLFKKDGYTVTAPEAEPKKEAATKKATTKTAKTTKKATTETVTVLLRTFTGLKIGTYTGKLDSKKQVITIHIGRVGDVEFNLDGTQKTINPSKNPKFNNRIEIIA